VLRLLDRAADEAAASGDEAVDGSGVDAALQRLGYDAAGLKPAERRYLALLRESRRPISLARMARMLGTTPGTVADTIEPHLFLMGLVETTPRGRVPGLLPSSKAC
jgi:Holliday junction resolvasome RuvABC ATP-dependent DNA helicase subunit